MFDVKRGDEQQQQQQQQTSSRASSSKKKEKHKSFELFYSHREVLWAFALLFAQKQILSQCVCEFCGDDDKVQNTRS